jgi:hypothetical protein
MKSGGSETTASFFIDDMGETEIANLGASRIID